MLSTAPQEPQSGHRETLVTYTERPCERVLRYPMYVHRGARPVDVPWSLWPRRCRVSGGGRCEAATVTLKNGKRTGNPQQTRPRRIYSKAVAVRTRHGPLLALYPLQALALPPLTPVTLSQPYVCVKNLSTIFHPSRLPLSLLQLIPACLRSIWTAVALHSSAGNSIY